MTGKQSRYNVVFVNTREAGAYQGVRTWTSFEDKSDFEKWYTPDIKKINEVFAEGVTIDEAVRLCRQTPVPCLLTAALSEATDPETGRVNEGILEMEIKNLALAGRLR